MAKIKVFYDRKGSSLTVWFGDPKREYVCEETNEEVVLIKDKLGHVVGFEKLNFQVSKHGQLQVDFSTLPKAS